VSQPDIFVETSIQVHRILAQRAVQEKLERQMASVASRLCSSQYVWMEFQRTVMADYAYVHELLRIHHGWWDVMAHLLDGQRGFRSRSAVRCTQILGHLYNDSQVDWRYARQLAEQALRRRLRLLFWTHVTPLPDPIICDLVVAGTVRQPAGSYTVATSCRKESAACHLPDFLAEHRTELRAIADYLVAHPHAIKDQRRVQHLLSAVLEKPRAALGQTSCWPLGDVIIALQVPAGAALWTLDADFIPLATALGIHLYQPEIVT
jgi:hypothetical protein